MGPRRQRFRLTLGPKLAFAVGGMLILSSAILAMVAIYDVATLGTYLESIHQGTFLPYQQAEEIKDALEREEIAELSAIALRSSPWQVQRVVIDTQRGAVTAGLSKYTHDLTLRTQPQTRALLQEFDALTDRVTREQDALRLLRSGVPELNDLIDTMSGLAERGQADAARVIHEERAAPLFDRLIAATSALMAIQIEESAYASRAGRSVMRRTERSIALTVLATLGLALAAITLLTRHITRPLKALVQGTQAVARGDLSEAVAVTTRDEIGALAADFNHMIVALRHERDRSQRYLDTAAVILLALDTEGRITLVNRHACAILGWPADRLLGCDWIDTCLPARDRDASRQSFERLVGGDLPIVETAVLTRSGAERLIEWRNTLLQDDAGQVIGTLSSGIDITERKQAEGAQQASEARYRTLFEYAPDGIVIATRDSYYLDANASMCRMLGYTRDELIGLHASDIVAPAELEHIEPALRTITAASDYQREWQFRRKDGSLFVADVISTLMPDGNLLAMIRDATERRALQEQYQQAQKMDAMGRLAGGVAHDFNNLLTVILGLCEMLLDDLEPNDRPTKDVIEIQKAGVSAAALTRQLLAFSRKQIIEPTLLDLNVIVTEMRPMLGRLIREDVAVVLSLRPELARVKADRGQVEQVILNLAVNARDAMPDGGTLTIETANVELDEHYARTHLSTTPGYYVVLTVTDTGTGMTPQVQARLFEPFFTTKGPGKGTGLGLATVHGIVTQSGGSIGIYSEPGTGTSFKVYFPQSIGAEAVVDTAVPAARPHSGGETVLVVEDADGLRELTRRVLQRQGYTVLVAANADEALRLFEENASIDVLLTDVVMPGLSGPAMSRGVLESRPELKVIYMSGYTEDTIVHHGIIDPGIAFLHKPFTSDSLGQKIREVLNQPDSGSASRT